MRIRSYKLRIQERKLEGQFPSEKGNIGNKRVPQCTRLIPARSGRDKISRLMGFIPFFNLFELKMGIAGRSRPRSEFTIDERHCLMSGQLSQTSRFFLSLLETLARTLP